MTYNVSSGTLNPTLPYYIIHTSTILIVWFHVLQKTFPC